MTSIILALLLLSGIAAAPSLPPSTSCALRGGADRAEPWTPEEDQKLLELQGKLGKKWKEISNQMGNRRSSKGCSARFARISANRASSAADQSKGREEQADGEAVKVEATEDRNVEAPKARLTKKQRTKPGGDEGRMREERTADASKHDDDEQQKVSTAKRALPDGVAQTDQEDFDVKADEANKKKRRKAAAEYEPATTQVVDHTTAPDLELFESKIEQVHEQAHEQVHEQVHEGDEGEREVTTDKASRDEIEKSAAEQGKIQDAWADLDAMREETRLRRQKIQSMWDRKTHAGKRTGFHVKLPVKKQSFGLQDGKKVKLRLYPLPGAINQRKAREQNLSEEEELEQEAIENRTSTEQEVAIQNQTFTDHKGRRWVFQSEVGDELHFVRARKSKKTKESKKAESLKTEECKKAESDLRSLFDLQPLPEGWDKLKPKEKRQVLREQANAFLSACVEKYSNDSQHRLVEDPEQREDDQNYSIFSEQLENLANLSNISDFIPPPSAVYPARLMRLQRTFEGSPRFRLHHFMIAAKEGNVSLLYQLRHFARRRDKKGWTALHYAVLFGRREAAKFILKCGVSPGAQNFHGMSPLNIAQLYNTGKDKDHRYFNKIQKILNNTMPSLYPRPGKEDFQDVLLKRKSSSSSRYPVVTTSDMPRRVAMHPDLLRREQTVDFLGPNAIRRVELNFFGSESGYGAHVLKD